MSYEQQLRSDPQTFARHCILVQSASDFFEMFTHNLHDLPFRVPDSLILRNGVAAKWICFSAKSNQLESRRATATSISEFFEEMLPKDYEHYFNANLFSILEFLNGQPAADTRLSLYLKQANGESFFSNIRSAIKRLLGFSGVPSASPRKKSS